jgi:GT2 family glycosyltransferase
MNDPKVALVILNWNGEFFLEKFLPSVYNSAYPNIEFVIGDNMSTDGSVAFVKEYYPQITIIQNDQNYGFAGGYNKILEQVEADYYILLNSDVEVTENWIAPVIAMLESNPEMVAAQPKILAYHEKSKFEHAGGAGGFIDSYGYPFCRGRIMDQLESDHGQYNDEKEIFWASGAAFFIKSHAWKQVKGFDADFFAHMEEIDLCWRLKKLDYKIGYCPQSVVYHVGGGTLNTSNPKKTYLNFRNNLIMLQKNLPFWTAVWVIFARLWLDLAALIKFLTEKKFKDAWAISRSHQYFFLNIFKTAEKRSEQIRFENKKGIYKGCIIWDFFVNNHRKFSDLPDENFE